MIMNIKDYLLASMGEEAGEIQQAVGKSLRFGLLDSNPDLDNTSDRGKTNWVQLRQEVHDLVAVYEMLCHEFDRVDTLDRELIDAKKRKVSKWMGYARKTGRLEID